MKLGQIWSWLGLAFLASCATPTTNRPAIAATDAAEEARQQKVFVLKARLAEQVRVAKVADRLMASNVDECPIKSPRLGFHSATLFDWPAAYRYASSAALGMTGQPRILVVEDDGPAKQAGLEPNDVLTKVGAQTIAPGPRAMAELHDAIVQAAKIPGPVDIAIARGDEIKTLRITPRIVCDYPVRIDDSEVINAYADGAGIVVTRGLLKLATTDEELAIVLGHEMAHNTEHHMNAQRRNAGMGMAGGFALDILAAAAGVNTQGAFTKAGGQMGQGYASPQFEAEADYIGLYFVARAGYDISNAEQFWRKMSVEAPSSIFVTTSHPANAQRYLALAATRKEIDGKRARQIALLPERQKPVGAVKAAPAASTTANALTNPAQTVPN